MGCIRDLRIVVWIGSPSELSQKRIRQIMLCFSQSKSNRTMRTRPRVIGPSPTRRDGLMQLELLVAAILLITLVGILSTIGFRLTRIAKDSKNSRSRCMSLRTKWMSFRGWLRRIVQRHCVN